MKYIGKLQELRVFNYNEALNIFDNVNTAKSIIQTYLKKGYIKKIRANLYAAVDLALGNAIPSKFQIASNISSDAFVSHHSAFEFYGYYNQIYNSVDVSINNHIKPFSFEGNKYLIHSSKDNSYINTRDGVRVSSLERAIVDCIDDVKFCDIHETIECIKMLAMINTDTIMDYLNIKHNKLLYKKVGLILELFKDKFKIQDRFFEECKEKAGNIIGCFDSSKKEILKYNKKWRFYTYEDLEKEIVLIKLTS